jgi:hypothetical protein
VTTFKDTKYDYHSLTRKCLEQGAFLTGLIFVTTYIFDTLSLALILAIPILLMFGILLFSARLRKSDFISLTSDGIFFSEDGNTGFIPWDHIKEIRCSWKVGHLVKADNHILKIGHEIEPADLKLSLLKRFFFNYRYKDELIERVRLMAPNAEYSNGF